MDLLYGSGKNICVQLVKNEKVKMISFTGSTETGKKIMSLGSKNIKRLSLELGGKNSIIIMKDADINKSVDIVIKSFCANSGQACVMTSKLLIDEKIKKIFINKLIQRLKLIKNFKSVLGPITTKFQFDKIHKLLLKNKKFNKNIIFGSIKKRKDNYLFPIIYDNIPINNEINKIEIFGPILSIISFTNVDEAIEIANSTNYGLSAVICCKNVNKARIISRKIECGRIWINNSIDISFPELPIGGFKESGFNRECGEEGFKTYSELKSVII